MAFKCAEVFKWYRLGAATTATYDEVWRKHEMSCIKDLRRRHKEEMARQRQKEPYREVVMENKIAHLRKQLDTSRTDKDKQARGGSSIKKPARRNSTSRVIFILGTLFQVSHHPCPTV